MHVHFALSIYTHTSINIYFLSRRFSRVQVRINMLMEGHVATTSDLAVLLQGGGWALKTADHFTTADVQYTGEGDITFAAIELESRASGAGL